MIDRMIKHLKETTDGETQGYLFSQEKDCQEVIRRYQIEHFQLSSAEQWSFLQLPSNSPKNRLVAAHFQHTGCGISSRLAEDYCGVGLIESREISSEIPNAEDIIRQTISRAHGPGVGPENILLASSGANAFHALFQSANKQAKSRRKSIWIRWGWLYLDTIEVMNLYGSEEGKVIEITQIGDTEKLAEIFQAYGDQIAGVVTEFPTNPLLQAGDLEKIRSLCDHYNALLIIDPTMVSPKNAKITHLADVVVNSLTKYAGWEGDVMMGTRFPRTSVLGRELFSSTQALICPPYSGDVIRMAEQIPFYDNFIECANSNALRIVEFLQNHKKVKKVHWAYQENFGKNYEKFAGSGRPGCNLSFELSVSFENFYNRLEMLKSPSFGTEFSNCCPYVYLAHYSLIQSVEGRVILKHAGLSENLLRLSVGLEPVEEIIETLTDALK